MRWITKLNVTQTEREAIVQLIADEKFGAWYKVGRIRYNVKRIPEGYAVQIAKKSRGLGLIGTELLWEVRTVYYLNNGFTEPSR